MTEAPGSPGFLETEIRPDDLMAGQQQRTLNDAKLLLKHEAQFVQIACPACNVKEQAKSFVKFGLRHVYCGKCHTTYVSPRPRPEHLAEYYEKSEDWAYWSKYVFPASERARRDKVFIPRVRALIEMCRKFGTRTGTLAEVGAGFGIFCDEIKKTGAFGRVIAIEPNPDLARNCRNRGIETLEQPFDEVAIDEGSLDVLASFEVIEHLFDPRAFLRKCHALLAPEGLLVISTPNSSGFDAIVLGEKWGSFDLGHLNLFNLDSLSELLQASGFRVIERTTPGKLDAELVRKEVLEGTFNLANQPFLREILVDRWQQAGAGFQRFLSDNLLSSHMVFAAQKQ